MTTPFVSDDRDELGRLQQTPLRVVPPHERLGAARASAVDVDDGLVEDDELVPVDRAAQLAGDREAALRFFVHRGLEQHVARLAVALRDVHRGVGVAQEIVRVVRVGAADRDADADARTSTWSSPTVSGSWNAVLHAIGDLVDLRRDVDVLDQQRELVATEAGDGVAGPDHRREPGGDRDQQLVAAGVAEAVVDQLEVVEVHEEHADRSAVAVAAAERVTDSVEEQRAVRAGSSGCRAAPGAGARRRAACGR